MSAKPNYIREWGTVCTHGDTDTLSIQMVTYLNVNFVYQEVYDMADLDFSIFLLTDVSSRKSVLSPLTTGLLYPVRPILIEKCLIYEHVMYILSFSF